MIGTTPTFLKLADPYELLDWIAKQAINSGSANSLSAGPHRPVDVRATRRNTPAVTATSYR
jgi:hypothetical protein